jgi:hypothetical protein
VVVFNLLLYFAIVHYAYLWQGSAFPPFVLFLSFSLSLGIILIIFLGETIDTRNVHNELVRRIGVTPIMVIVAIVISILAGFSPLAAKIVPSGVSQKFVLMTLKLTCLAEKTRTSVPEASHILTVISSQDISYIKDVQDFLHDKDRMGEQHVDFVSQTPQGDQFNTLLFRYARSDENGAAVMLKALQSPKQWIAYTVTVLDPDSQTWIPVPTRYEKEHETRLFAIVTDPPTERHPEVASLDAALAPPTADPTKRLVPLLEAEIVPRTPLERFDDTDIGVKVFANRVCWHISI